MLEDIEEARQAGLIAIDFVKRWLMSPLMQRHFSTPFKIDLATLLVTSESLLRPMSQAAFMRQMSLLIYGFIGPQMEETIRQVGYSEVLPQTHPDAIHPILPALSEQDPTVRQSYILSALAQENKTQPLAATEGEMAREPEPQAPNPEPMSELPPNVEAFLRGLGFDDEDHPINDGGEGGSKIGG